MDTKSQLPKIIKQGAAARYMEVNSSLSNSTKEANLSFSDSRRSKGFVSSESFNLIKTHQLTQTPKSETDTMSLKHTRSVSSMFFDIRNQIHFDVKPLLSKTPPELFNSLFLKKCEQCLQICDFNSEDKQKLAKSQKTEILVDILAAVSIDENVKMLTEVEYKSLYDMFTHNIIRITPPAPEIWFSLINTDLELELVEEVGWPHMSLIYDIMTVFFKSKNFNMEYCTEEIISLSKGIVDIFHSPDIREREKLMKLFHAFYKSCSKHRYLLRREIKTFMQVFMCKPYRFVGISEILSVIIPIISGCHIPLHREYIDLFNSAILPLHSSDMAQMFHCPLATALTIFCNKEPTLISTFILYVKNHWPKLKPVKQNLFLSEIESLIPLIPQSCMKKAVVEIISLVSQCAQSYDYVVSERALLMWKNEKFIKLIVSYSKITYPILLPSLFRTANEHWCENVSKLAVYVLRVLKEFDVDQFNEVGANMRAVESVKIMKEVESGNRWQSLVINFGEDDKFKEETLKVISKLYVGNDTNSVQLHKTVDDLSTPDDRKTTLMKVKPTASDGIQRITTKLARERASKIGNKHSQSASGKYIPKSIFTRQKRI
jgi:serine/threonine-protein phosphatase 2A regulatory subunit B'